MIVLKQYIAGKSARSLLALSNIKKLTSLLSANDYTIEVIDLLEYPELASENHIIAIPTTVRVDCNPVKKVIGDLSQLESARLALDISI